jgi:hypothetical protein
MWGGGWYVDNKIVKRQVVADLQGTWTLADREWTNRDAQRQLELLDLLGGAR